MKAVGMIDIRSQYYRLKEDIDKAVLNVFDSAEFINGNEVKLFEQELAAYNGSKYAVACANGTDALQIALMALNIPPGSEIITPAFSYASATEVCHLMGWIPVFCEVHPDTFLMDVDHAETLITSKTKAVIPVHLFGQVCNMQAVMQMAERHQLYVIEDNAQAIGSDYTFPDGRKFKSGAIGHISTTSFFPTKNLGCFGDGGAVLTNDENLARTARMIANHGQESKYIHHITGMNSRLDTVQAAILRIKLRHLDEFARARNRVAKHYFSQLGSLEELRLPAGALGSSHVYNQFTIKLKNKESRTELQNHLKEKGIATAVYYPMPLYDQIAYRNQTKLEITEHLCNTVLSLPMGTEMDEETLEYITHNIKIKYSKTNP
jgi:dTDP-4-amino-4,6-dideoxygalactose transaminase